MHFSLVHLLIVNFVIILSFTRILPIQKNYHLNNLSLHISYSWVQGYDGSRAEFINRDTVCFKCGNSVKFVSEDGHESVFPAPGDGIGALAVHSINKVFAVADIGLKPKIQIYQYPSFREIATLEGENCTFVTMIWSIQYLYDFTKFEQRDTPFLHCD